MSSARNLGGRRKVVSEYRDHKENFMHKSTLLGGAVGVAMLFGVGSTLAQTVIEFTPEQERTIYSTVIAAPVRTAPPADVRVVVGAELPDVVELYDVPTTVEYPAARRLRYTVVDRQVVLVDPGTRRVIRVIRQ
jgi:hypothetical protein